MKKIITILCLATCVLWFVSNLKAQEPQLTTAPLNPEFVKYMNDLDSGKITNSTNGEHVLVIFHPR